jgi:3-isopropylmalate dehydrogenase
MKRKVIFLPGDGIGPEVSEAAQQVLTHVAKMVGLDVEVEEHPIGGRCIDLHGVPILERTVAACREADAVFLGAVGGPKWDRLPIEKRPEKGLLQLRRELEVFANLRPVRVYAALVDASPLKADRVRDVDLIIVRELTGGLYFGEPKAVHSKGRPRWAVDTMKYDEREIERIARTAFELARNRRKKVTSVDKANVLATSQLWRQVVEEVAQGYPEVQFEHMLVDNCAMQLIRNPQQFDVILTENMFGDILSDEAAMLTGSLGMLPSASLGKRTGLYEPVHGSAPDIAGQDRANPIAAIASVALMFRYSFQMEHAARAIERAIANVLRIGYRPADLASNGEHILGTRHFTRELLARLDHSDLVPPHEEDLGWRDHAYWLLESMHFESKEK